MNIPSNFRLATSSQAKSIDARTIEEAGVSGPMLMEVAGAKAAEHILLTAPLARNALIVCGKGNNAGDALVAARYLSQNSLPVTVAFAEGTDKLSPDARANFDILRKLQARDSSGTLTFHTQLPDLETLGPYDIIVDGLLGIGIAGEVRPPYGRIIDYVNKASALVYAMDIPSGLHADDGSISGSCIQADYTYCFGTNKLGCSLGEGPARSGKVIYVDLGFPAYLKNGIRQFAITADWVDQLPIQRRHPRHKYETGNIYVIAGSEGMTGAAIMTAESSWKAGAGSVSVITPRGLMGIMESRLIHQTKHAVGKKDDVIFNTSHYHEIMEHLCRRKGTVAIGPGLGRNEETKTLVKQIIRTFEGNIVIDADAIQAIGRDPGVFSQTKASVVLTPHPGELNSLTDSDNKDSFQRMNTVTTYCQKHQVYMLSKGMPGIIAAPDGSAYITQYDTIIFSRTGFGDILTGKIATLWEMTGNPLYSCAHALLDGKSRYDKHLRRTSDTPEPLDLL